MTDTCKTCRFVDRLGGHGGVCKRYPPQVLYVTNANGMSDYINERPFVSKDDWCGEFKAAIRGQDD